MKEKIADIKPRLKVGALIHARQDRTYVGTLSSGIEVNSPIRAVLDLMNGNFTCEEICTSLGYPLSDMETLVSKLADSHLIDTEVGKIRLISRFHSQSAHRASHAGDDSNDGAYLQLQSKLSPELSFTTWLTGVTDGGVGVISARRSLEIDIYGSSRISTLLFGILLSSGVVHTRLHVEQVRLIGEADICAGYLRSSDIGLPLASRTRELSRELSLFPIATTRNRESTFNETGGNPGHKQVAVVIGNAPAELLQEWMSQGRPHLLIENPDAASITIGPLVIPGKTPCGRCIALARDEQGELWNGLAWQKSTSPPNEVPVAVAHHVAGLIALELLCFIDSQTSELSGTKARIDYHSPMQRQRAVYARHPACGCSWIRESALK